MRRAHARLAFAVVLASAPGRAAPPDATPSDAAPRAQSVDFSEEEGLSGGDVMTPRKQQPAEFDPILPDRFRRKPPAPEPQGPPPRRGCASCAVDATPRSASRAWPLLVIGVVTFVVQRRSRHGC